MKGRLILGLVALGLVALVLAFTNGCASIQKVATPERVSALTKLATYAGAKAVLIEKPGLRPELERARDGFCALVAAGEWSIERMADIAAAQGLDELRSDAGVLALTGGTMLIDLVYGKPVDLSSEPYARAVVEASCSGLTLALGPATRTRGDPILARLQAEERATR